MTTPPTSNSVFLTWEGPADPNGIISSYTVLRRTPSLRPSPLRRDVGVAFDGSLVRQFPSDETSLGGISNTITFSFRTFSRQATLLYYINSAGTDYLALELRQGVPWFFFDAGSGPAVIRPDFGGVDMTFDDGEWHRVTATQNSRMGTITVDGRYSGTNQSLGSDQVISSRQVLYVGGIPAGVPRSTALGTQLSMLGGRSYAGCMFGLVLNGQGVEFEESEPLREPGGAVTRDVPGCPVDLEPGVSLLGGGYLSYPPDTFYTNSFSWSFMIRTTHSQGLIFLASARNHTSLVGVELRNSRANLVVWSGRGSAPQRVVVGGSGPMCDGEWHTVLVDQSLDEVFVSVDGIGNSLFLQSTDIVLSSAVFFGGVPFTGDSYVAARGAGLDVDTPLSGCLRPRTEQLVVGGAATLVELPPSDQHLVRFDGCHVSSDGVTDTCADPWQSIDVGTDMEFNDTALQPLTGGAAIIGWWLD